MNTFPTHPFGGEIKACDIVAQMEKCKCWEDKYRQIIQWGKKLPVMEEALKSETLLIPGCESQVWLIYEQKQGHLYFAADSDARIVKGLIAIVLAAAQGLSPQDLKEFDFELYFEKMNLLQHISPSRNNGIHSIINKIKSL